MAHLTPNNNNHKIVCQLHARGDARGDAIVPDDRDVRVIER